MQRLIHEFQNCPPIPQTQACPSAEDIAACLSPNADPVKVAQVVEHCSGCPACAEDWRVARALSQQLEQSGIVEPQTLYDQAGEEQAWEEQEAPQISNLYPLNNVKHAANDAPSKPWWRRPTLQASAALCAVAVALLLIRAQKPEVMRGEDSATHTEAAYRFDGRTFSWPDFEPGAEYQLSVFNEAGDRLLDLDHTSETFQQLSPARLTRLRASQPAYWQVRTLHGSGRVSPVIPLER